ncbi:golgi uridine diphosphate-N- acetylglucosamine transporter [Tulasnella sp. JGI-2019a]|nr:golgi uridine diphosphate-N- acetylglucosamine transporter [Tulasnella sp. JGI-2019a]KAG9001299.1 golgi uridine diphosphate-N- acetylglucosamine transporter [Tulasnella sp. JGI-2019a]
MALSQLQSTVAAIVQSTFGQWALIISLIFGGCGCNAWALETVTARNPHSGTLISFAQYLLIVVFYLPKHLSIVPKPEGSNSSASSKLSRLRFKKLQIPFRVWVIQVFLFWLSTVLNNAALGYNVSVAVHMIFRSANLPANLLLGWLSGKKYTRLQVLSVILVTFGVVSATLSSTIDREKEKGASTTQSAGGPPGSYAIGVALLTVALALSAAMGLAQEKAYAKYGKGHWEEALFYLHFLGLPLFSFVASDLITQLRIANSSPKVELLEAVGFNYLSKHIDIASLSVPSFWIPLAINIVTQLICVSGVHRLTSRVSSLTVTLVLAVRKAISVILSVLLIRKEGGDVWLWGGGALVLFGTIAYSLDGTGKKKDQKQNVVKKQE